MTQALFFELLSPAGSLPSANFGCTRCVCKQASIRSFAQNFLFRKEEHLIYCIQMLLKNKRKQLY